jgi:hypothetical protein
MTKLDESKRASVRPSELLAAAAAIAAGTQAYGEVVIFINPAEGEPGHFDWDWAGLPGTTVDQIWLDITRSSTDQGGGTGPTSVGQLFGSLFGYIRNLTNDGAEVARGYSLTWAFSAGELIDSSAYYWSDLAYHVSFPGGSAFPNGVARYMGVRFSDIDGYHYGWIGVVPDFDFSNPFNPKLDFDAFAWGYETEPGVPIIAGIPAPGTLAALAFGAVVTRRKRKDD